MLDNNRQELIATRLRERNAMQPCQRCLSEHFEILAEAEMPLIANNLSRMSESFANPPARRSYRMQKLRVHVSACQRSTGFDGVN